MALVTTIGMRFLQVWRGVGGQKNRLFVNFYTIENVNGGGYIGGQKKTNLVNVVCERPLIGIFSFL